MTFALLVVACLAPVIAILWWVRRRQRPAQYVTYLITLGATFAGVWLAIVQSDLEKRGEERAQVVALIDPALATLGARWTFEQFDTVPYLDQMAGNPLVPKFFEPFAFQSLVLFNVVLSDSQFKSNTNQRREVFVTMYYVLCLQRHVLDDRSNEAFRRKLDEWAKSPEGTTHGEEEMKKDGCYISKPYGTIGI
jgi:hypothetical protein